MGVPEVHFRVTDLIVTSSSSRYYLTFETMTTVSNPFSHFYVGARQLEAAEKSKDPKKLKELDFSVNTQVRLVLILLVLQIDHHND